MLSQSRRRRQIAAFLAPAAMLALSASTDIAAATSGFRELFAPLSGLWVAPSDHGARLYGPTSPLANWSVVQWNIPKDLPPFQDGVTENKFARVALGVDHSVMLAQYGDALPCVKTYRSGVTDVHELDLFLTPNTHRTAPLPEALVSPPVNLGSIHNLLEVIELEPVGVQVMDHTCPVTKTTFITSITLTNKSTHQTLFYELRLGTAVGSNAKLDWTLSRPFWFATDRDPRGQKHGYFGYGDSIGSFGQSAAALGESTKYSFDLLQRLISIIGEGARFGLDQNLSNWIVGGAYYGEMIWGHIRVSAQWRSFSLVAQ